MKRRTLAGVMVAALACAQVLSALTGAKNVSVCGAGGCFTAVLESAAESESVRGVELVPVAVSALPAR